MLKVPRWITRKLSRYEICRNWQFLNHRKPQEVKLLIRNYVKSSYRSLYFTPSFHIFLPSTYSFHLRKNRKAFSLIVLTQKMYVSLTNAYMHTIFHTLSSPHPQDEMSPPCLAYQEAFGEEFMENFIRIKTGLGTKSRSNSVSTS